MARKFLKRCMPNVDKVREYKLLHLFGERIFHPALWHLNRRSAAGGIAVGLFCGLLPAPFQMLSAGIVALWWRVNLPLALATTLYTNPLTIVPLYVLGYKIGRFVLSNGADTQLISPPDWVWSNPGASMQALSEWLLSLGMPLLVGVLILASVLALLGYVFVRVGWNIYLRYSWAKRKRSSV